MTEKEIVQAYRSAQNLHQIIMDLAVKAHHPPQVIRSILRRNGYVPPEDPAPTQPLVSPEPAFSNRDLMRTLKLIEMVEQGASTEKIAEVFGISFGQALTWKARLLVICEEYVAAAEESEYQHGD